MPPAPVNDSSNNTYTEARLRPTISSAAMTAAAGLEVPLPTTMLLETYSPPAPTRRFTQSAIKIGVKTCVNRMVKKVEQRHLKYIKELEEKQRQQEKALQEIQQRRQIIKQHDYTTLPTPSIPDIKQVDLYLKYSRFVPEEFRSIICPKPDDLKINKIKELRKETSKKRLLKIKSMKNVRGIVGDDGTLDEFVNVGDDDDVAV